jgi:hypothetical protein
MNDKDREKRVAIARLLLNEETGLDPAALQAVFFRKVREKVHQASRICSGVFFHKVNNSSKEESMELFGDILIGIEGIIAALVATLNEFEDFYNPEVKVSDEDAAILWEVVRKLDLPKLARTFQEEHILPFAKKVAETVTKIPDEVKIKLTNFTVPITAADPQYILVVPESDIPDCPRFQSFLREFGSGLSSTKDTARLIITTLKAISAAVDETSGKEIKEPPVELGVLVALGWFFSLLVQMSINAALAEKDIEGPVAISDIDIVLQEDADVLGLKIERYIALILANGIANAIKKVVEEHPEWSGKLTRFMLIGQIEGILDPEDNQNKDKANG